MVHRWIAAVAAAAAFLAASAVPAVAARPDSAAPRGASPDWLPDEEWVMERWLPFDSERLFALLRTDRTATYDYLHGSDRTLLDLARRRGVPTAGMVGQLMGPRPAGTTLRQWALLRARTARVVNQGHLAEHMLGHHWHHSSLIRNLDRIVGGRQDEALSLAENGRRNHVAASTIRLRVLRVLATAGLRGVIRGAVPSAENRTLQALRLRFVDDWIGTPRDEEQPPVANAASAAAAAPAVLCRLPAA